MISGIIFNTGFYQWTVPKTLPYGNDYKIRVIDADLISSTNVDTGPVIDDSDASFSIVSSTTTPSIRVISPNGGENWTIDSYQKIKWSALNDKTVSIYLKRYISCLYAQPKCRLTEPMPIIIAENIPNIGEYDWQVGNIVKKFEYQTLSSGSYIIEIRGNNSGEVDVSDKPLQIVYTNSPLNPSKQACIQATTFAYDPKNPSKCQEFSTPCDVPEGWLTTDKCQQKNTFLEPMEVPVLVIKYYPTQNGRTIDTSITLDIPQGRTIKEQDEITNSLNKKLIKALTEGSKYHGYKNSNALPFLTYKVIAEKTFLKRLPLTDNKIIDYFSIMKDLNVCDYVDNKGVKEIWIWAYASNYEIMWESNFSSIYGDISNSNRDPNDLPVCKKSYTVYTYNYGREYATALENHGHQIEHILNWIDGRDITPNDQWDKLLFWGKFVGRNFENKILPPVSACGWIHSPPNTEKDYHWYEKTQVFSDCEDWNPNRTGKKKPVNCVTWTGNSECKDDGGGEMFKIWWMQNIPGYKNELYYNNIKLRNWWEFIGDFDEALKIGKSLTY
ncbi:MAG: hypothetical protein KatS3mg097_548 [Candidatus Parcubacteria bacterium]|nr:MAG: hypothetical protein KatS3mg097_548 [Candidatus Parcubacteria bacterium]